MRPSNRASGDMMASTTSSIMADAASKSPMADSQNNSAESPWLSRPPRPNGDARTEREPAGDAPARPDGEPPLVLRGLDELRRTVVRMVARRAAAFLKERKDATQGPKG